MLKLVIRLALNIILVQVWDSGSPSAASQRVHGSSTPPGGVGYTSQTPRLGYPVLREEPRLETRQRADSNQPRPHLWEDWGGRRHTIQVRRPKIRCFLYRPWLVPFHLLCSGSSTLLSTQTFFCCLCSSIPGTIFPLPDSVWVSRERTSHRIPHLLLSLLTPSQFSLPSPSPTSSPAIYKYFSTTAAPPIRWSREGRRFTSTLWVQHYWEFDVTFWYRIKFYVLDVSYYKMGERVRKCF